MDTQRILVRSLAVTVVIASVIWTTTGKELLAEEQKVISCCTKVSSSEVTDPIISIKYQRESLPCVKAVIFETERGNEQGHYLCRDPRQRWVKEKVKQFFRAQRNKGLTSTPPPTSSITQDQKVISCCTKVSTTVVTDPIISLSFHHESLPCMKAVIFETERGKLCCDHKQRWVKKKAKQIFRALRNQRLTSTHPPTSSITQDQKVISCCTKVSSSEVTDPIIGFRFQHESLPCVKAVIFEMKRGNNQGHYFCSDPRQPWVKEKVRQFLNKNTTPSPTSSISDGARV